MSWSALRQTVRLSRHGQHSDALSRADVLLAQNLADPRIYYQLALVELEAEQPERALQTLERAAHLQPDSPVLSLYRALTLGQLERWPEALDQAHLLQQQSPHHQFSASLLCYVYLGLGEVAQALKPLQIGKPAGWVSWFRPELAAFAPLLSRLLLQLELYLLPLEFSQLNASEARSDPEELEVPPQSFTLRALVNSVKGLYWQRKGIHYWEKGLTRNDLTRRHNYLEKALQAQRRAVELEPQQFRGYYHLGEALLYSSTSPNQLVPDEARLREAEKCFVHSWAKEGPNPYLYFYLGRTVQLMGQPLAAQAYLERALEKFEKFPEAHYALGQVHLLMGQRTQAREWLKRSVSSDFLPVAKERLLELFQALEKGKVSSRPPMPQWPPIQPTTDSDPTVEGPESTQSPATSNEETPESHQCGDPQPLPESHETFPENSDLERPEHPANSSEPESAPTAPVD